MFRIDLVCFRCNSTSIFLFDIKENITLEVLSATVKQAALASIVVPGKVLLAFCNRNFVAVYSPVDGKLVLPLTGTLNITGEMVFGTPLPNPLGITGVMLCVWKCILFTYIQGYFSSTIQIFRNNLESVT